MGLSNREYSIMMLSPVEVLLESSHEIELEIQSPPVYLAVATSLPQQICPRSSPSHSRFHCGQFILRAQASFVLAERYVW